MDKKPEHKDPDTLRPNVSGQLSTIRPVNRFEAFWLRLQIAVEDMNPRNRNALRIAGPFLLLIPVIAIAFYTIDNSMLHEQTSSFEFDSQPELVFTVTYPSEIRYLDTEYHVNLKINKAYSFTQNEPLVIGLGAQNQTLTISPTQHTFDISGNVVTPKDNETFIIEMTSNGKSDSVELTIFSAVGATNENHSIVIPIDRTYVSISSLVEPIYLAIISIVGAVITIVGWLKSVYDVRAFLRQNSN